MRATTVKSQLLNKLKWFFLEHINWCHPVDRNGNEKKPTLFYRFYCVLFYPIPWQDQPCWCCASARGLLYGIILGLLLGVGYYEL